MSPLSDTNSALLALANVAAVLALLAMMLGVGLALGPHVARLARSVDRRTAAHQVLVNAFAIPLLATWLVSESSLPRGVVVAVLLMASFPAGPISLLFVSQKENHLVRASGVVLLLQLVSLVSAPLLLLTLGGLLVPGGLFENPFRAASTIAVQVFGLELLPIAVGAWLSRKVDSVVRKRLLCRRVAMAFLLIAGLCFARVFFHSLMSIWAPALLAGLCLVLVSWAVAGPGRGSMRRHDSAQIAVIRNMSLALVVASSRPELREALLAVLLLSAVITLAAPVLRLFGTAVDPTPDPTPAEEPSLGS